MRRETPIGSLSDCSEMVDDDSDWWKETPTIKVSDTDAT